MIVPFDKLGTVPKRSPNTILAHGCFDPLHVGHVRYLTKAKLINSKLVVTVTADEFVTLQKGSGRPFFTDTIRAEMLAALRVVDCVSINPYPTAVEAIRKVRPEFYCKGIEYKDNITPGLMDELLALEQVGGKIVWVATPKFSSTELIQRLLTDSSLAWTLSWMLWMPSAESDRCPMKYGKYNEQCAKKAGHSGNCQWENGD